ncbi:MAG: response regulator [Fimbriiglobus sp.]|jgi:two-component system chemotaxis response regulator CheY|nr:response regulator [Fimbriiglobus sp.]
MTKTVLVVDDSPTLRRMLTDTLHEAGYEVVQAINGADALERANGRAFHLVITDFNMPVMNGPALITRLRATAAFKFTPILVLTTESSTERKGEGKAAGATGWMVKPFDPDRLVQVVRRLVP